MLAASANISASSTNCNKFLFNTQDEDFFKLYISEVWQLVALDINEHSVLWHNKVYVSYRYIYIYNIVTNLIHVSILIRNPQANLIGIKIRKFILHIFVHTSLT